LQSSGRPPGVREAVVEAAGARRRYPDPLCRRLGAALSGKNRRPAGQILFGNGAADLIFRLALAARPKRALVTAPTFAEYELALETVGCRVFRFLLEPAAVLP
jgi:threonine-phosphate decarboxylase